MKEQTDKVYHYVCTFCRTVVKLPLLLLEATYLSKTQHGRRIRSKLSAAALSCVQVSSAISGLFISFSCGIGTSRHL